MMLWLEMIIAYEKDTQKKRTNEKFVLENQAFAKNGSIGLSSAPNY